MRARFFFDAYALLRIASGAAAYAPYQSQPIVTERGHLYEFARAALKTHRARDVAASLALLRATEVDPTMDDLLEAAKLHRVRPRLSAQDALGYVLARREGLRFLTGDSAFEGMPHVELVP